MKRIFNQWADGDYTGSGSFQQKIFEAYTLASANNQRRLLIAFPEWFDQNRRHSAVRGCELQSLRHKLMEAITHFSLTGSRITLCRPVPREGHDEMMFEIDRYGDTVMVLAARREDGEVSCHDLVDLSAEDLLAVLQRLEEQEGDFEKGV